MEKNNKIVHSRKKIVRHVIAISIITIFFIALYLFIYNNNIEEAYISNYERQVFSDSSNTVLDDLKQDDVIIQIFNSPIDSLSGINIKFETYEKSVEGICRISVVNKSDDITLFDQDIEMANIIDNQYFAVKFDKVYSETQNDELEIKIHIKSLEENNRITLRTSEKNINNDQRLTINHSNLDTDISLKAIGDQNKFILYLFNIFSIIILLFIYVMYYFIFIKKIKVENIYLIAALVLGVSYLIILPPFTSPDEPVHFSTAYVYSNYLLGIDTPEDSGSYYMRGEDADIISNLTKSPSVNSYRYIYDNLANKIDNKSLIEVSIDTVDDMPYLYLPASLGITISRVLSLGTLQMIFLGRLFMMLAYVFMTYFAIKKLPFAKMSLFLLAIFPMTLEQGSSYSYDAIINGLSFLVISYGLFIAFSEKQFKIKDVIIYFFACILIAPVKGGAYIPLCLLTFLVPLHRFARKKTYIIFTMGVILSVCIMFSLNTLGTVTSIASRGDGNIIKWAGEQGYTIGYLLDNPLKLFSIMANTIFIKGDFYYGSMIGSSLGWLNIPIMNIVITSFAILFIFSSFKKRESKQYITYKHKTLLAFIIISSLLLICLSMLLGWTPLSYSYIEGVQGRYFIPLLLLTPLLMRNNRIVVERNIDNILIFSPLILHCIVFANIVMSVI